MSFTRLPSGIAAAPVASRRRGPGEGQDGAAGGPTLFTDMAAQRETHAIWMQLKAGHLDWDLSNLKAGDAVHRI